MRKMLKGLSILQIILGILCAVVGIAALIVGNLMDSLAELLEMISVFVFRSRRRADNCHDLNNSQGDRRKMR